MSLMDVMGTVDTVYMNFSEVFDTIPLKVPIEKLVMYELDGQMVGSIKAKRLGAESGDQWHKVQLEIRKQSLLGTDEATREMLGPVLGLPV